MVKIWGNVLLAISMLMSGPADFFPVPEKDFSVVVVNAVILGEKNQDVAQDMLLFQVYCPSTCRKMFE